MVMMPPKPRTIVRDVRKFIARRERHNIVAAILAAAIPAGILYLFVLDGRTNLVSDEPVVIYAESWPLGRSDEEIIARQREFALAEDERRRISRERFQQLADGFGIDYDREAAAEADEISDENQERLGGADQGEEGSGADGG